MFGCSAVMTQKLLDLETIFVLEMKIHCDPCRRCWPQPRKGVRRGSSGFCFPGGRSLRKADIKNSTVCFGDRCGRRAL